MARVTPSKPLRRASRSEGRAVGWLTFTAQHEAETARGDIADATAAPRYDAEGVAHDSLRCTVAVAKDGASEVVLDFGAFCTDLTSEETDALKDLTGSNPVTTIGTRSRSIRLIRHLPHHGTDMTRFAWNK